ncbi:F0F1 ATP synthase subunit A [Gardnerella swidsinskii]|uniref:F0F1 ATP synthase subunit A n=1 Tax=Gardnerella TaxID=2701 RepID=UPI000C9AD327|nr:MULTISPECIES: F0F1 ATP synthase subunit A [Gardnerella]PMC44442.1 ATP synthase F0 subunit A [Gardnerella vaginalis]PNP91386.1 ATP synthase F0 subunit A [Gardnerella sp. DNF01162]RFD73583.1 ATP synthase F0F1 subunit A [Gardnerella vaginalis]UQA88153.1 F0F1 ATP synthase subunit A [Gardnerella swidsinskii]
MDVMVDVLQKTTTVASTVASNKPELPNISEFLPPEILFQGTPFAMNRIILVRLLMVVVVMIIFGIGAMRAKVVPGRFQSVLEILMDFVRYNIVYEMIGEERGKRYVPMMSTLFLTIFFFNLCSVIPGLNMAATATIACPLVFALWVVCQYLIAGIREKGFLRFFREALFPAGVPWPIYFILSPLQLIELIIVRPLSLTIRLFANMIAGHLLVATCLVFTNFFVVDSSNKLLALGGALWLLGGILFTLFEIMVAGLQAFIFTVLASVYISESYPEEEEKSAVVAA